jgi:hypothetical protein
LVARRAIERAIARALKRAAPLHGAGLILDGESDGAYRPDLWEGAHEPIGSGEFLGGLSDPSAGPRGTASGGLRAPATLILILELSIFINNRVPVG